MQLVIYNNVVGIPDTSGRRQVMGANSLVRVVRLIPAGIRRLWSIEKHDHLICILMTLKGDVIARDFGEADHL